MPPPACQGFETVSPLRGPCAPGAAPAGVETTSDVPAAARLMRVIADAYRLANRPALIDTVLWWQERCRHGTETAADAGDPAMIRLRALGTVDEIRAAHDWTHAHRHLLEQAVTGR
jgi:hypothetical protein